MGRWLRSKFKLAAKIQCLSRISETAGPNFMKLNSHVEDNKTMCQVHSKVKLAAKILCLGRISETADPNFMTPHSHVEDNKAMCHGFVALHSGSLADIKVGIRVVWTHRGALVLYHFPIQSPFDKDLSQIYIYCIYFISSFLFFTLILFLYFHFFVYTNVLHAYLAKKFNDSYCLYSNIMGII